MSRHVSNTVNYFPHDANASNSDTLIILEKKYGSIGFCFWFKLLEKLCKSEGHFIDCNNSVKWQLLLSKCVVLPISTVDLPISTSNNVFSFEEIGENIMQTLVDLDAIDGDLWKGSRVIWCQKLVNNLEDVYINRRRDLPQKPLITDNNKITTSNIHNTTNNVLVENPQSKVKESKVNKRKRNNKKKEIPSNNKKSYGEFLNVLLTDEELDKLKTRFGDNKTNRLIEILSSGIESKGYKYKSHYATILNWDRRDNKDSEKPKKKQDELQ